MPRNEHFLPRNNGNHSESMFPERNSFPNPNFTVSEDAGIGTRTFATLALVARCSNHSARSHPQDIKEDTPLHCHVAGAQDLEGDGGCPPQGLRSKGPYSKRYGPPDLQS